MNRIGRTSVRRSRSSRRKRSFAMPKSGMLEDKIPPNPLCGCAKLHGTFDEVVCTKMLYNDIDQELLRVRNIDLPSLRGKK